MRTNGKDELGVEEGPYSRYYSDGGELEQHFVRTNGQTETGNSKNGAGSCYFPPSFLFLSSHRSNDMILVTNS